MAVKYTTGTFIDYETTPLYTYTTGNMKVSWHTTEGSNLFSTKAVQVKAGFLGQVLYQGKIVWESKPKKTLAKADKAAAKARDNAVARLFEEQN